MREVRTALREILKREPTAAELRYLSMGDSALGDKSLLRLRAQNALQTLGLLRESGHELLQEMRRKRRQMLKLRANSSAAALRNKAAGKKKSS